MTHLDRSARDAFPGGTGIPAMLVVSLLLCGCTSSGLRGVGSSPPSPQMLSSAATELEPSEAALQEGTPMNIATEPSTRVSFVQDDVPPAPEMAVDRAEALAQIRAKADALDSEEKTNVFERDESSVARMSTEQKSRLKAEMAELARRNQDAIPAEEAERKTNEIRSLQREAQTHYRNKLNTIEK